MTYIDEQAVLKAVTEVAGPHHVGGISIDGGHVRFTITVDPREGVALDSLRNAAEKAVQKIPGVEKAQALLTAEKESERQVAPGVKYMIAVASGKGGVGKSTVAVNLAAALAANGQRIGLLDADIYGPSVPLMMGLTGQKPELLDNKMLSPLENHGIKTMSIGFLLEEDMPLVWRGPMVQKALFQMLRDVDWGTLDVLVVDLPPGTGDAQLTLAQKAPLSGAVIVSTPQDIALLDATKAVKMFEKIDVPVLGLIENMSMFACPHCGEYSDIFGCGGAKDEAARLHIPFLGALPLNMDLRRSGDDGIPAVIESPDSPPARIFRDLATRLWTDLKS